MMESSRPEENTKLKVNNFWLNILKKETNDAVINGKKPFQAIKRK